MIGVREKEIERSLLEYADALDKDRGHSKSVVTRTMRDAAAALRDARTRADTLAEVRAERARQDEKWGGVPGIDRRDDHTYAAVLGEEFGECCKAWLERDTTALRTELIQTAAVALAWVAELDNGGSKARPDALAAAALPFGKPTGSDRVALTRAEVKHDASTEEVLGE